MHRYTSKTIGHSLAITRVVLGPDGDVIGTVEARVDMRVSGKDGDFVSYVLYGDDMRPIRPAYRYLNKFLRCKAPKTRKQCAYALRFLYCFLLLAGAREQDLDGALLTEYIDFLRGAGYLSTPGDSLPARRNTSINKNLAAIRGYYRYCGIDCPDLFRVRAPRALGESRGDLEWMGERSYSCSLPERSATTRLVPKYITAAEFARLIKIAESSGDKAGVLLMRMMFLCGLRLGEALGLTIEDVIVGQGDFSLCIRNRMSDKAYQYAKGRTHPSAKSEYGEKTYVEDWQFVGLGLETYECLEAYVNEAHIHAREVNASRYETTRADVVSSEFVGAENHYIFLNRLGGRLTDQTWSRRLKSYFKQAGVSLVDTGEKNALSHRFRHGFAMYHAHFSPNPVTILQLKVMMRHRFVSSTAVYFNLTEHDVAKLKAELEEEIDNCLSEGEGHAL